MAVALCSVFGAQQTQQPVGVAGVDVMVKQKPTSRAVTDARGNFALGSLAPGWYTLVFKARKAQDVKTTTSDKAPSRPHMRSRLRVASAPSFKVD